MKTIMISIKPKWVAKILNGEKTIEIRKKFPKDYVGWVYIYNTKTTKDGVLKLAYIGNKLEFVLPYDKTSKYQGKVVARFWCDKVEEHRPFFHWCIEKETCLTRDDVLDYLDSKNKFVGNPKRQGKVYAIHITKLEIFDKLKEINEFCKCGYNVWCFDAAGNPIDDLKTLYSIKKPPQSWCYVEV